MTQSIIVTLVCALCVIASLVNAYQARRYRNQAREHAQALQPSMAGNPSLVISGEHTAKDRLRAWEADRRARRLAGYPEAKGTIEQYQERVRHSPVSTQSTIAFASGKPNQHVHRFGTVNGAMYTCEVCGLGRAPDEMNGAT